jgi:tetratricopeptide (TPR) repeat protein
VEDSLSEKSSRKELREPDKLVTFAQRFVTMLRDNMKLIIVCAVVVVAAALVLGSWRWVHENNIQKASAEFSKSLKIMRALVVSEDEEPGKNGPDGSYRSEQDKYEAALQSLLAFKANFGDSDTALLADYYVALCQSGLGRYKKARAAFGQYLEKAGLDADFSAFAIEGLGIAWENQGEFEKANLEYQRLTQEPFEKKFGGRGLYHQARMLQKTGKLNEAVRMYKQLLKKYGQTPYAVFVKDRLAGLPPFDIEGKEESGSSKEDSLKKPTPEEKSDTKG